MLFDLRSKSRRRTVRVVYAILALIMLSGLILVGVGTGNNNGGLLNALGGGGSTSGQSQAITQEIQAAVKATKKSPKSESAWLALLQARWSAANSSANATTGAYTAGGKVQLADAVIAWQKYLALTNQKPTLIASLQAARLYEALSQWSNASTVWQYVIQSQPAGSATALKAGYQCTAFNSYAAKQTSKGELAAAAALKITPKLNRLTLQQTLTAAKTSQTTAAEDAVGYC